MKILRQYIIYPLLFLIALPAAALQAQTTDNAPLEKMPAELETDFALSALPPHIRPGATVYLLDPAKGYYISKQGNNGFICFVARTEWEYALFSPDVATSISFDAVGTKTVFPIYTMVFPIL